MADEIPAEQMSDVDSDPSILQVPTKTSPYPPIGSIPDIPVGIIFENRRACAKAGLHTAVFAGISGSTVHGAYSIVLSDGYEDDSDNGEFFTYIGTGGQINSFSGKGVQISDQTFLHLHNKALKMSAATGRPVRVIRGRSDSSKYAPSTGYRYDGLYHVERAYLEKGRSGFLVCKYDLRVMKRQSGQSPLPIKY